MAAPNQSSGSLEIHPDNHPADAEVITEKTEKPEKSLVSDSYYLNAGDEDPTNEDLHGPNALRRISAPIPWAVYTVAFVELCERFSYYGTQVLCKSAKISDHGFC